MLKKRTVLEKIASFISHITQRPIFTGYKHYTSNDYYQYLLDKTPHADNYLNILNAKKGLQAIQTHLDIQPDILNTNIKNVLWENGKPFFVSRQKDITVFVYKWKFNLLKNRCTIHFYKGTAFLVTFYCKFSPYHNRDFIFKKVINKYLDQDIDYDEMKKAKIIDRANNLIFIDDDIYGVKISYMTCHKNDWYIGMTNEMQLRQEDMSVLADYEERRFYDKI